MVGAAAHVLLLQTWGPGVLASKFRRGAGRSFWLTARTGLFLGAAAGKPLWVFLLKAAPPAAGLLLFLRAKRRPAVAAGVVVGLQATRAEVARTQAMATGLAGRRQGGGVRQD